MHWYFEVLKKYAVFSGRARRKEYWLFLLFSLIVLAGASVIDGAAGLADTWSGIGVLSGLYAIAVLIPGIAVSVRRLHDTDHSGWWALLLLVPVVGFIVLLIFTVRDGQPGHNRFGPNPKGLVASSAPVVATALGQVRTPAEMSALMAFCSGCGTRFPEVAAYCPKCGAPRTA